MSLSKSYVFGTVNASTWRAVVAMLVGIGVAVAAAASDADASVISGFGATVLHNSTGSTAPSLPNAPNNDDAAGASPNTLVTNYFAQKTLPYDFEFLLTNSGGTSEYQVTMSFANLTAQTWTNFYLELGFGVGGNFVRSGAGDGLDFDGPPAVSGAKSLSFPEIFGGEDTLTFAGGSIGQFRPSSFSFFIDLPDHLQNFNPAGVNAFTLRATPNGAPTPVPEPATMMLIGSGLAAALVRSRKRLA